MARITKRETPTLFDDPGVAAPYNPELRAHVEGIQARDAAHPPKAWKAPYPREITPTGTGFGGVDAHKEVGLWRERPNNTQLKGFMTAREIKANYAPAEGDRMYHGTNTFANLAHIPPEVGPDPRAGEVTQRPARTDRITNKRTGISEHKKARLAAGYTQEDPNEPRMYRRRSGVNMIAPKETDEQMWERKRKESRDPTRGPGKKSLVGHLKAGGDIGLIHLGLMKNPNLSPDERKTAKPMVAGSQHRIEAMNYINKDQYLPVMHHENIVHAKFEPEYD